MSGLSGPRNTRLAHLEISNYTIYIYIKKEKDEKAYNNLRGLCVNNNGVVGLFARARDGGTHQREVNADDVCRHTSGTKVQGDRYRL